MTEKTWDINLNRSNNQIEHTEQPYSYGVTFFEVIKINPNILKFTL